MKIIPILNSCCCIFSLKFGTISIGALEAVVMLSYITYNIFEVNYIQGLRRSEVYTTCAVLAVRAILDILLIFGAKNKYWLPVKLWIVFNTIILMLTIYTSCLEALDHPPLTAVLKDIIPNVYRTYCLLIVNSFYRNLLSESYLSTVQVCKCQELQHDISILYLQSNIAEVEKNNQWQKELHSMSPPVLEPI